MQCWCLQSTQNALRDTTVWFLHAGCCICVGIETRADVFFHIDLDLFNERQYLELQQSDQTVATTQCRDTGEPVIPACCIAMALPPAIYAERYRATDLLQHTAETDLLQLYTCRQSVSADYASALSTVMQDMADLLAYCEAAFLTVGFVFFTCSCACCM